MQLYSKFVQDVHKEWMQWHAKPSNKEIPEHHSFVCPRTRNKLCTRRMPISLQKIVVLFSRDAGHAFIMVNG
jgi:hypothetical protein